MLATYNEIDLAGELQSECCEHDIDQTECDCFCHEPEACAEHPAGCPSAIIIPFPTPGGWEPDDDPPAACALCLEDGAQPDTGLCSICSMRLPRVGGCGLAVWLVAGLTSGESGAALGHLTECRDCRTFFDTLGELARAAGMEASIEDDADDADDAGAGLCWICGLPHPRADRCAEDGAEAAAVTVAA